MSINGIAGLSVAIPAAQTRTHASGQNPAEPSAIAQSPASPTTATPPGAPTEAAAGGGTFGALSPSVLAALMGQDVNLTAGSFAAA